MRSVRATGRIAGFFYLLTFITGLLEIVVSERLIVRNDPASTVANFLAHPSTVWFGFACDVSVVAWYLTVTALLYVLLRPVDRNVALVAAFFSVAGCASQIVAAVFHAAPLVILTGTMTTLTAAQLHDVASIALKLYILLYDAGLVFFGVYCLLTGTLIVRSTFLPKLVGALMIFAGIGWLTFLWPPLASALYPYNLLPGLVGEGTLTVWLLTKGVDEERYALVTNRPGPK
jgi:hypothetical protein